MAAAFALALPSLAQAAATDWVISPESSIRIISAVEATGTGESVPLGLHFQLAEGWKIYWRSPGDAGFPPILDSEDSVNLAALDMRWPAPIQFDEAGGLVTRGYEDEVVFPFDVRLATPGEPLSLRLRIDYQICEIICIPASANLSLDLPAGVANPSSFAQFLAKSEEKVPLPPEAAGLLSLYASLPSSGSLLITARSELPFDASPEDTFALIEGPPGVSFRSGHTEFSPDLHSLQVEVAVFPANDALAVHDDVDVTLIAGTTLAHARIPLTTASPSTFAPASAAPSLAFFLLLAILGGLILNLMPCVLPVLALKVVSLTNATSMDRREVSRKFLATSAGIIFSFALLSLAVIVFRNAGHAAGWGFQFQEPSFIAFLAVVMLLFAGNLFGLFEISLPSPIVRLVPATASGSAGSFAQGAFATLLATPCAAPVVGTAVGFALAHGSVEIVLIFLGLGIGMALPWLALAVTPRALTILPRPGPWMVTLRRILAVLLLGTVAWLLSIIQGVVGYVAAGAVVVFGLGVIALLASAARKGPSRVFGVGAAVFALLAILAPNLVEWKEAEIRADADNAWMPLEPAAIAKLATERVVFVDVTADWCVTCLVNKSLVLDRKSVRAALESEEIVRMRGDWTLADPTIANYLASFGRYGIPFNAVYGPEIPAGKPLPEILTENSVLSALRQAKTPKISTER